MRDLLPHVDLPDWALWSGPLMLMLFCAIVCWVYRRDRKKHYDAAEALPLGDD